MNPLDVGSHFLGSFFALVLKLVLSMFDIMHNYTLVVLDGGVC